MLSILGESWVFVLFFGGPSDFLSSAIFGQLWIDIKLKNEGWKVSLIKIYIALRYIFTYRKETESPPISNEFLKVGDTK